MSDIFEEVEESLRQDKAANLWKRFGPIVWVIGILIIGTVGYREWSVGQAARATEARIIQFEDARAKLEEGDYAAAQTGFETLANSGTDIAPLAAQFLARSYYEGNGDVSGAADVLELVAGIDTPMQKLALLKAAYLRADTLDLAGLESFLGALPSEPTAFGALALELIAAKALREGDLDRARQEFSYLRFAPNAPQGVVQRAETTLTVIPAADVADEPVEGGQADPVEPASDSSELSDAPGDPTQEEEE